MDVQAMSLFFALLSMLVVVGVVGIAADALAGGRLGVNTALRPLALELAAAIATVSTLGSLYMSEIADFVPCRLCWVQRFFMYPAALLLIGAVILRRPALRWPALALSVLGLPVSIFHRWEQANPDHSGGVCDPQVPCSDIWVLEFGFVTIPTMAGIGFAGVIALIALHTRKAA